MDEAPGKPAMLMWVREVQNIIRKHVNEEKPRIKDLPPATKYEMVAKNG